MLYQSKCIQVFWLYCDAQGNGAEAEEVDVADVDNRLVQHVTSVLTDFIQLASTPQQEELSVSQVCSVCAPAFLRDRHSDGSRNTIRFRYHIQSLLPLRGGLRNKMQEWKQKKLECGMRVLR